jgi:hypothetical protein
MLAMESAKEPAPNYNTSVEHARGPITDAIVGVDHATGQSAVTPSPAQPAVASHRSQRSGDRVDPATVQGNIMLNSTTLSN